MYVKGSIIWVREKDKQELLKRFIGVRRGGGGEHVRSGRLSSGEGQKGSARKEIS